MAKIKADNGAEYSETIFIDLNELEPMIANHICRIML